MELPVYKLNVYRELLRLIDQAYDLYDKDKGIPVGAVRVQDLEDLVRKIEHIQLRGGSYEIYNT